MQRELRQQIKEASEKSGINKLDFIALLKLIDEHYDKMEANITQSLSTQFLAPNKTIDLIFDSVADALLSVGEDGVVRNCNKTCSRFFGIAKPNLIGSSIVDVLPDAGEASLANFLNPYISNRGDAVGEVVAARSNGETFPAEINASTMIAGNDKVFVIGLRDISERKEAEKTLRENEERYSALVEDTPEAIVVFDVDSDRFVDANDNACLLFNYSRSRLLSIGPQAICPPVQADGTLSTGICRDHIESALNGEHPKFEWLHRDANGRNIPCEVHFSRLPAGDRKLIRISITDIAERKRNDEFSSAQNKILEMIAGGTAYDRTLQSICRSIENTGSGMRAAIMQLDVRNQVLHLEQAPSLPDEFKLQLDFIKVEQARYQGCLVLSVAWRCRAYHRCAGYLHRQVPAAVRGRTGQTGSHGQTCRYCNQPADRRGAAQEQ